VEAGWNPPRENRNEARAKKGLTEKTNTRTATIRVEKDKREKSCKKLYKKSDSVFLDNHAFCVSVGEGPRQGERQRERE